MVSAFHQAQAFHFMTQLAGSDLVVVLRRRSRMAAEAFDADDELADEPGAVDAALASSNAGTPGPA